MASDNLYGDRTVCQSYDGVHTIPPTIYVELGVWIPRGTDVRVLKIPRTNREKHQNQLQRASSHRPAMLLWASQCRHSLNVHLRVLRTGKIIHQPLPCHQ